MKIYNVQLKTDKESVLLTADCDIRRFGSDQIYFKFDKKYQEFISADASPFAASLLIPAMKLGEDLIIEGSISEQLYQGMYEIMKIFLSWNIGLKPISIIANKLEKDNYNPAKNASFFSGGVDSFFTYLKNKKYGDEKIKYFILANGYDIDLHNRELWDLACQTVDDVAKDENIEVIKIESNIRNLIEPIMVWDYTHGGCLAALGLCLRKELKNIFIGSSYSNEQLFPWGSHPQIDHLWNTESLSFHHDGSNVTRIEKVKFISKDMLVLKNLRVCYLNKKSKFNCGVCDKCLRTMINLRIAGVLEKSKTFPHNINIELIKKLEIEEEHGAIFHRENLIELEKQKIEYDLQKIIREKLKSSFSHHSYLGEIIKKVRFLDYFYNRDRLYKLKQFLLKDR